MADSGFAARDVVCWARSVVFAVTSVVLACAAHGVCAGELPNVGMALMLTAVLTLGCRAATSRERGLVVIIALLCVSQVVLHLMLTWLHSSSSHGFTLTGTMLMAHTVAAVGTGLVLARAEAAVFAVARILAAWWPVPPAVFHADRPLWVAVASGNPDTARAAVLRRVRVRRGPPLFS
jgi:hypothetical protein